MNRSRKCKIAIVLSLISVVCVLTLFGSVASASAIASNPPTLQSGASTNEMSPTFYIYACPTCLAIEAGGSGTSKVVVCPVARFNGTVDLSVTPQAGVSGSLNPSSPLEIKYNESKSATLTITVPPTTAPGKYNVTISGKDESLSPTTRSITICVEVVKPDFEICPQPSWLCIVNGTSETAAIRLYSIGRFNGTVSLSANAPTGWPDPTISEQSLYLNYSRCNSTTISVAVPSDAATGYYTVTITGTSDSLTHSVNITVCVINPDFYLYACRTFYVTAGSEVNSTVCLASIGRYNGTIDLSASTPSGWQSPTFALTSLYLNCCRSNCTTLSINVPQSAQAGKYIVTVTGTDGHLTHSANITICVIDPDIVTYACPSFLYIPDGTAKNTTLTAVSLGRYNGTVSLTANFPSALAGSKIYTTSLSIRYDESNSTKVLLSVSPDAAPGKYLVQISATSNPLSLSDSTNIVVVVP